jgi:hypothetical protein
LKQGTGCAQRRQAVEELQVAAGPGVAAAEAAKELGAAHTEIVRQQLDRNGDRDRTLG